MDIRIHSDDEKTKDHLLKDGCKKSMTIMTKAVDSSRTHLRFQTAQRWKMGCRLAAEIYGSPFISPAYTLPQVDVLYPTSPLFLVYVPRIFQGLLVPILDYANNDTQKYGLYTPYNLSWAPHHLGKWPSALKQKHIISNCNMVMVMER